MSLLTWSRQERMEVQARGLQYAWRKTPCKWLPTQQFLQMGARTDSHIFSEKPFLN